MNLQSKFAAASVIAALALSAAQPALAETSTKAPDEAKSCFFTNQISGWNRIDDKTIRVTISSKRQYDLTLMTPVAGGFLQENIGIKSHPSSLICTGSGLGVSVFTGGDVVGPSSYPVTKVALAPIVRKNAGKPESAPETAN